MSIFAKVEDICSLVKRIHNMKTIDDVNEIFDTIVNTSAFHSEYGLFQICHMFRRIPFRTREQRKALNILSIKLHQTYEKDCRSHLLMSTICFTPECTVEYITNQETTKFTSEEIDEIEVGSNEIINIKHGDEIIATFKGSHDTPDTLSVYSRCSHISITWSEHSSFSFNVKNYDYIIGDINDLETLESDVKFMELIEKDDVDGLIQYLCEHSELENLNENNCSVIYENHITKFKPIELAALCGSVSCFKYMMINGLYSESFEMYQYIVLGQNLEIFRLTHLLEYIEIHELWYTVISTHNEELISYWRDNFDINMDSNEKREFVMEAIYTFNYEFAKMLIQQDSVIEKVIRSNRYSFNRIAREHLEFALYIGWKLSDFDIMSIHAGNIPYVLSITGINTSMSIKNNTFLQILKQHDRYSPKKIEVVRDYMYPKGIPGEIKKIIIQNFYKFVNKYQIIITEHIFEYAQLTPQDIATYEYREGISLIESIVAHPVERISVELIGYLYTNGFNVTKFDKKRFENVQEDTTNYDDNSIAELYDYLETIDLLF